MNGNRNKGSGFIPRERRGIIGLTLAVVVAFVLGSILFGGREERATEADQGNGESAVVSSEPTIWTCSMHPQIRLPKPGKCPICFMDLIAVESGTQDELGPRQLRLSDAAKKLAEIQTTPVVRAFAEAEVRMVGKVAYDEAKVAYITAWVPGRLDRLYADYTGITVNKGDHLVDMYSPELLAAQEELIQANRAAAALENTSSQVLRSTAEATRDAAREKLRLSGLTAQQIERIETNHETSDHLTIYAPIGGVVVHKDAKEGMYVSTGTRIYTIADLKKLWVIFEAYESDLPWLRFGQKVDFISPSFPGERFEAFISFIDPLVDPKTRTVKIRAVVENKQKKLKPDMFVSGVVKSQLDAEGNIMGEYLANKWICPMHPEVVKDGPGKCDICGMDLVSAASLGFVRVTSDDDDAPLLIPASAPLVTGKRAIVYVEIPNDEGPLFEGREVTLGPRAGDFYVVRSGVEEGERVVSNGAFKIDSELQIQAKPSMMSPEGGAPSNGHQHDARTSPPAPSTAPDPSPSQRTAVSAAAPEALTPVYDAYFDVQMALAKDDLDAAKKAGKNVQAAVATVDMSVFSPSGRAQWMDLSKNLSEPAKRIANANDIKAARDGFFYLSQAAIALHDDFGHAGTQMYYLTHCPRARQGDGADWLQTEDIVWNSFYGARMQRCGTIKKLALTDEGAK